MSQRRVCPVCKQRVMPTKDGCIKPHRDGTGETLCPMNGQSYELADVPGDTAPIRAAKELLERSGYTVLKTKSYNNTQRTLAITKSELEWERRESERTREWAWRELATEIRGLRDRVTFLYGVARARGASVNELSGLEATA